MSLAARLFVHAAPNARPENRLDISLTRRGVVDDGETPTIDTLHRPIGTGDPGDVVLRLPAGRHLTGTIEPWNRITLRL